MSVEINIDDLERYIRDTYAAVEVLLNQVTTARADLAYVRCDLGQVLSCTLSTKEPLDHDTVAGLLPAALRATAEKEAKP